MGGAGPQRGRRGRGVERARAGLASVGLTLAAWPGLGLAPVQDDTETTAERWARLRTVFADLDAADCEELDRFVAELAPQVLAGGAEPTADEVRILYVAAWRTAEGCAALPTERRLELHELAYAAGLRSTEEKDSHRRVNARTRLARFLSDLGRNVEAREVLEEARTRHAGERNEAYLLWDLAEVCRLLGDTAAALEHLEEAAAVAEAEGDATLLSLVVGLQAQVHLTLGVPDLAAPLVEAERLLAEEVGTAEARLSSYVRRANLALVSGDYAGAIELVDSFLADEALFERRELRRAALLAVRGIAESHLERREPERPRTAEATLREALAEPKLPPTERVQAEIRLAELMIRRGARAEADALLVVVRGRLEEWRLDPTRVPPAPEYAWLTMLEARSALDRGAPREVLEARLAASRAAFEEFLSRWESAPLRAGGIGFLKKDYRRAVLSELVRLHLAVAGPEEALADVLRAQAMGTLVRRAGAGPGSLADVRRELLAPGRGLVVLLPALERSHAFAVDSGSVEPFDLPPDHVLAALQDEHAAQLRRAPSDLPDEDARRSHARDERAAAEALATALLPPALVERLGAWSEITFVGTELLGEPDLESLPTALGPHLGVERALGRLPSLPLGLQLAERAAADRGRSLDLVLVAAPSLDERTRTAWPEVAELVFGERELGRLTQAYPPGRVLALHGADATRSRVLGTDLAGAHVLQLLVHGVVDPARERPLGLVLGPSTPGAPTAAAAVASAEPESEAEPAPGAMLGGGAGPPSADALLWSEDVEALDAPPLVLLTACRAGSGPVRKGDEGTARMSAAWLDRGAGAVVQSFASLDYAATLALSEVLHARLAAGDSPAEALRAARAALVADAAFAAPFYHGTVHVVGLAHRPPFPDRAAGDEAREEGGGRGGPLALAAVLVGLLVVVGLGARAIRGSTGRS